MMQTPARKRPHCPVCARPQGSCICHWITPVTQATEVLILQHPLEVGHAKNSAGLLHLCLANSRIVVGEAFDADALQDLMKEPKYTVLLYPASDVMGHTVPPQLETAQLADPSQVRLVVLDATWRKSRKMLHLSPWLQSLPRLSLDDSHVSNYSIRKAHKPGQCSTLEATCAALAQIQGDAYTYLPLLQAFQGFVAQQAGYVQAHASAAMPSAAAPTQRQAV